MKPLDLNYSKDSITFANRHFISLVKTDKITWLESENHLKKVRKEKLEDLRKL